MTAMIDPHAAVVAARAGVKEAAANVQYSSALRPYAVSFFCTHKGKGWGKGGVVYAHVCVYARVCVRASCVYAFPGSIPHTCCVAVKALSLRITEHCVSHQAAFEEHASDAFLTYHDILPGSKELHATTYTRGARLVHDLGGGVRCVCVRECC